VSERPTTIAERHLITCALFALQGGRPDAEAVTLARSVSDDVWTTPDVANIAAALRHEDRPRTLVDLAAVLDPDQPARTVAELEALADECATDANAVYYHRLLVREATRREIAAQAKLVVEAMHDPRTSMRRAVEVIRVQAVRAASLVGDSADVVKIGAEHLTAMGLRHAQPVQAVPTFLPTWTDACRGHGGGIGLAKGWHVVIGGASGTGKSISALNLTAAAIMAGHGVAWVSLEMTRDQLLSRLLAILTNSDVRTLEPGPAFSPAAHRFASEDFETLCRTSGGWLALEERPARELPGVIAQLRAAADAGASLVVLDYLQLVQVTGAETGADAIKRISNAVQAVAYECGVVTVALSQYNRAQSFGQERPTIHGLTGGSAIENDADQVLLIDKTEATRGDFSSSYKLLLAKNRHGPALDIGVTADSRTLRWSERDLTPDHRDAGAREHGIATGGLRLERRGRGRP
jgi:replicative DNA helicase